jgi:prepilin-type N-terminal cleavage/methylation domain-containing protein
MLNKKLSRSQEKGFTIIEVLIVLAIAGLILLIVFLAVPALQRNARNTQRSNDVAGIIGAYNEWVNNNGGSPPGALAAGTTAGKCDNGTSFCTNAKTSIYDIKSVVSFLGATNGAALNSAIGSSTTLVIGGSNVTCNGGAAVDGNSTNQAAFVYNVESGSGTAIPQCKTAG